MCKYTFEKLFFQRKTNLYMDNMLPMDHSFISLANRYISKRLDGHENFVVDHFQP